MKKITSLLNKKTALLLLSFLITGFTYATTFTAVVSGSYTANSTWMGGIAPPTTIMTDSVVIPLGITVNENMHVILNGATAQLNVQGTLNTANSSSLTLTLGTLSGTGFINLNTVIIGAASTFTFTGALTAVSLDNSKTLQTSALLLASQSVVLTAGTLTLISGGSLDLSTNGNIIVNGGLLATGVGGSVGLTGIYNVAYTTVSSPTGVELSGSGLQDVTVNVNTGNSVSLTADLTVPGTLTLTNGSLVLATHNLNINSTVGAAGSGKVTSTSLSNITFNSTGGTTGVLNFNTASTVNNLTVNVGIGSHAYIGGTLNVTGVLQLNSGSLNFSNANLIVTGSIVSGVGMLSGNTSSNLTVSNLSGPATSLDFKPGYQTINNLTISLGNGNVASLVSDLSVNGALTLNGGTNLNLNGHVFTLDAGSTIAGSGMLASTSLSGLTINATSGITNLKVVGTVGYLTINTGGTVNVTLGMNLQVDSMLTLQSGVLKLNNYNLAINGDIATAGTGVISSTSTSDITIGSATDLMGTLHMDASANTVGKLTINIADGGLIGMGTNIVINDTLKFIKGKLYTAGYAVVIAASGVIDGSTSFFYVITDAVGYLQMNIVAGGGNALTFPIGTPGYYAPALVSLNVGSTSGPIRARVVPNVLAQGNTGADISLTTPTVDATWDISTTITTAIDLNLEVMWSAAMEVNSFNRSAAYLSHYTGGAWDVSPASASAILVSGMYGMHTSGITSLSPFAVFDNSATNAIAEVAGANSFSIYPNPATNQLSVISGQFSENAILNVYDLMGREVLNSIINHSSQIINVSTLPAGTYFIKLSTDKTIATKSFVKM